MYCFIYDWEYSYLEILLVNILTHWVIVNIKVVGTRLAILFKKSILGTIFKSNL